MNIETFIVIPLVVSNISVLLPFTLLILKLKAFNPQLKAFFVYIFVSMLTEITMLCFLNKPQIRSVGGFLFTIIETGLISYMFIKEFKQKHYTYFIKIGLSLFLISSIAALFFYKNCFLADDFSRPFEFALIVCFAIMFFYKVFIDLIIPNLLNYYFFWFNTAFLVYFGANFILFLLFPYVDKENKYFLSVLGIFHLLINIIYNILLSIGIWKIKKN